MEERGYTFQSREQRIAEARASCMRQLERPAAYFSHVPEKEKLSAFYHEKEVEALPVKKTGTERKLKMFVFRLFLSIVLFGAIYAMQQFKVEYQQINVEAIKKIVADNYGMEEVERVATKFVEDNVVPTFHNLNHASAANTENKEED